MRVKIRAWLSWSIFVLLSLHIQSIVWNITRGIGMQYFTDSIWLEANDLLHLFNPLLYLFNLAFQPIVTTSMTLVILIFMLSSITVKPKWSDYVLYSLATLLVYIGFIYYFKLFQPLNEYPTFTWLDDFTSKRSYDLYILFSYFIGNFVFMLIYIPIWKWFRRWVTKQKQVE